MVTKSVTVWVTFFLRLAGSTGGDFVNRLERTAPDTVTHIGKHRFERVHRDALLIRFGRRDRIRDDSNILRTVLKIHR